MVNAWAFADPDDWEKIDRDDVLSLSNLRETLPNNSQTIAVVNKTKEETYAAEHSLSNRQVEMMLAGGLINMMRKEDL